jgi:hypothetical protein
VKPGDKVRIHAKNRKSHQRIGTIDELYQVSGQPDQVRVKVRLSGGAGTITVAPHELTNP